jgi:hypothetical protein
MNSAPLGLTGLGFWLALALVVISIVWAVVRKQQMKHELTLKLLEKGQGLDTELLAKLLAPDRDRGRKSAAEQHRDDGGFAGFMLILSGLAISFVAMVGHSGLSLPLLSLGAFTFLFGNWVLIGTIKEYNRQKEAERDLSRN